MTHSFPTRRPSDLRANRSIYMPDIVRVLLLALFPAAGNFAGGMLAEAIRTSRRSLSIALHLAAGIVFGVIAVELAPRTLESLAAWLAVTGFIAGRSEERRVGKECVSPFRFRWSAS